MKNTLQLTQIATENDLIMLSRLPLDDIVLTSGFGYRTHPLIGGIRFHNGIDLSTNYENVYSVLHGSIVRSHYDNIIGNYVVVKHGFYETTYGHLSIRYVKKGDLVKAGSIIGISGKTGSVTGRHLHFGVKYQGRFINPLLFLKEIITINKKEKLTQLLIKK